jgi:NitT/TauT family transport system permease protein
VAIGSNKEVGMAEGYLAEKVTNIFYRFGAIGLFIGLWQIACSVGLAPQTFVASPGTIVATLWGYLNDGSLAKHVAASLSRTLYGFSLAVAVGVPLGLMLGGWFKNLERILNPLLTFLSQFNPFALFSVFMLLFGIGEISKVAMIFWVCIWPILYNATMGVKTVDPLLIKLGRSMGLKKKALLFRIVLPSSASFLFNGIRMAGATAFFMLIPAEMMGASRGLGWLIINAQVNYQIPKLYTGTLVIVLFGIIIDQGLKFLEKKVIVWKIPAQAV